jgi:hypothetical protein
VAFLVTEPPFAANVSDTDAFPFPEAVPRVAHETLLASDHPVFDSTVRAIVSPSADMLFSELLLS